VPEEKLWPAEPHTLAKHELLRRYLAAWYPILTQQGYHARVVFIDGFAGPGVYQSGEEGSPIVALRTLVQHGAFSSMKGRFVFLFIEREEERMENLKVEIAAFWASMGGQPENIVVMAERGEFEQVTGSLLASLKESGNTLAPTVAFVDPFGFAGVSLDAICRLTSFPRCEVIFSFMYDSLNRWVTHPTDSIHEHLRSLFGSEAYLDVVGLAPRERKTFLHDLYKRQLLEVGNFKYVLEFEMVDRRGKSVYSLFFGTRHIRGLEAMKSAMWSLDPSGEFRFSDRHAGQTSLFGEAINVEPLRQAILVEFAGKQTSIERIHEFVLAETIFGPSHYKVKVLKPLQREGLLEAVSGQKRRGTFPQGTVIRFEAPEA
jgi:three-Cys-motif partner protein